MATRHFSTHTMLRMTPNRLLKEFFEQMGHPLRFVPWHWLSKRCIGPILRGMEELPKDDYDTIEAEMRTIFDLAYPAGSNALAEAGATVGRTLVEEWSPKADSYEKAMWTWLRRTFRTSRPE